MATQIVCCNPHSSLDIELKLRNIFMDHPDVAIADDGSPVIPVNALIDIFCLFTELHAGRDLLASNEMEIFKKLIASNPDMQVTPQVPAAFISQKMKQIPMDGEKLWQVRGHGQELKPELCNGSDAYVYENGSASIYHNQSRCSLRDPWTQAPSGISNGGPSRIDSE
ncbi:hypothetical protein C8R43DRAFT_966112, partial [Mycena crocata]